MHIRLRDDFVPADYLIGPMPDLIESFETFLKRKAFDLLNADKCLNGEDDSNQGANDRFIVILISFILS